MQPYNHIEFNRPSARWLLILAATALALAFTSPVRAQQPDAGPQAAQSAEAATLAAVEQRLLVGVEPGAPRQEVEAVFAAEGLTLGRYWPQFGVAEALVPPAAGTASTVAQTAGADMVARSELIRYVEPDQLVQAAESDGLFADLVPNAPPALPQLEPTPDDPYYTQQWALPRIRALQGWNITHGDPGVVVAIIDSGYTPAHPDFDAANLWNNAAEVNGLPGVDDDHNGFVDDLHGWDWVGGDNAPVDSFGHGTHVLGTVAAATGNGIGVAGSGRALTVAPLRILDGSGYGLTSDVVAALAYAMDMKLSVANLSLTTTSDNFSVHRAIQDASNAGMLIVAAAGNTAKTSYPGPDVLWPAAYPETIAVAATNSLDQRADFSNYGPEVTVAAPGVDILSLYRSNNYVALSGTSMATPHVSALLGLLHSLRPDLAAADLIALMTSTTADVNTADYPGVDDYLGAGRIDMGAALLAASEGLSLNIVPSSFGAVDVGQALALSVQVRTPDAAASPVEGAMVYIQVLSATDATDIALITLRSVTNSAGDASFSFVAPNAPGAYIFRAQVGTSFLDKPSFRTVVTLQKSELTVGGEETLLTVTMLDSNSNPITDTLPLHLEASLGTLNGQSALDAVVAGGVFTGTLRTATVAGTSTVTATVRLATGVAQVVFLPGPPVALSLAVLPDTPVITDQATIFTLAARLEDAYGNPAADGIGIRFSSSAGEILPPLAATTNGSAVVKLSIPRVHTDPVDVDAAVEDARYPDLDHAQIQVTGVPPLIWMPLFFAQ